MDGAITGARIAKAGARAAILMVSATVNAPVPESHHATQSRPSRLLLPASSGLRYAAGRRCATGAAALPLQGRARRAGPGPCARRDGSRGGDRVDAWAQRPGGGGHRWDGRPHRVPLRRGRLSARLGTRGPCRGGGRPRGCPQRRHRDREPAAVVRARGRRADGGDSVARRRRSSHGHRVAACPERPSHRRAVQPPGRSPCHRVPRRESHLRRTGCDDRPDRHVPRHAGPGTADRVHPRRPAGPQDRGLPQRPRPPRSRTTGAGWRWTTWWR